MTSPAPRLSTRLADLTASPIRDLLARVAEPGMISFAGGLPAYASFPRFDFGALPTDIWQYGASEGDGALRAAVAAELATRGLAVTPAQVLILSGSQQGIDLVAKLCVDRGTEVAVESPTYLAALQVFRFFGARFVEYGANALDAILERRPALTYALPTFQNPTGRCYDLAARRALAAACAAGGSLLFEDDPYRALNFDDTPPPAVCADLAGSDAAWVYQGSFSKSLAPGLRLGYLACAPSLLAPLTCLKQAADLHSNRLSQALVLQALRDPRRDARLTQLRDFYRTRRDGFAALLRTHFAGLAEWTSPPGGLFFWLQLARPLDTRTLLAPALARGVAFMPGEAFFADPGPARGALRLNFSHASPTDAARGLAVLADVIADAA